MVEQEVWEETNHLGWCILECFCCPRYYADFGSHSFGHWRWFCQSVSANLFIRDNTIQISWKINVCFQLFITIGIFAANIVNCFTGKYLPHNGWRYSLGGAAVPAIVMGALAIFLPDTPSSQVDRGKVDDAKLLLKKIRGVENVDLEYKDILEACAESKKVKHPWRDLRKKHYRPQLCVSVLIPLFQQFTGINVVMFYALVLFKTLGFGGTASLMSALITGGVNVLATFISVYGTDKWGRRPLFLWGGLHIYCLYVQNLLLIGIEFGWSGLVDQLPNGFAIAIVACICCFVSAFACSWGPLGWLVPSEIFHTRSGLQHRASPSQ
ncbi:unnamed protein product [Coffea canephora]|uniref:DH200=94 genomic scaffold, scaffold_1626 n=1 Tax=Coffea canephora TaxID=49390 RepID=A0A068VJ57_COFCA|nr:unnamed protein product [Coffea canephora]